MKCPRTGSYLTSVKVGGIAVQISEKCGGVFFDNLELEKFKNGTELRGNALVKHLKQFSLKLPNEKQRINCPKCAGTVMMRRFYSPLKIIEIENGADETFNRNIEVLVLVRSPAHRGDGV